MESRNSQPETRNPQQEAAGGLQPESPELQPVENENGSELNPNQLPKTDNLQVTERNNTGAIQVQSSPSSTAPIVNGTSLWVFSGATLILAIILLLMAKVAKPGDSKKPTEDETSDKPAARGAVQKDKVIASKSKPAPSKVKKKTKKKKKK